MYGEIASGTNKGVLAFEVLAHLRRSEGHFYQQEMEAAIERVQFLHEMPGTL